MAGPSVQKNKKKTPVKKTVKPVTKPAVKPSINKSSAPTYAGANDAPKPKPVYSPPPASKKADDNSWIYGAKRKPKPKPAPKSQIKSAPKPTARPAPKRATVPATKPTPTPKPTPIYSPPISKKADDNAWIYGNNPAPAPASASVSKTAVKPTYNPTYEPINTAVPVAVPIPKKSETNPFAAIGYSFLGSAVDTVASGIEYMSRTQQVVASVVKPIVMEGIETLARAEAKAVYGVDVPPEAAQKIIESYVGGYSDKYITEGLNVLKSKDSTASKTAQIANMANAKVFDVISGQDTGVDNQVYDFVGNGLKNFRKDSKQFFDAKADLQNQNGFVNFAANVVGSIPYTAVSRIPAGIGVLMNYGASSIQAIDQKIAEAEASGIPMTNQQKSAAMGYANASALINAGTEQIFPAGKGAATLAKAIAGKSIAAFLKEATKFVVKNGAQEATEEGLSYIGTGLAASITTNPVDSFFTTDKTNPDTTLFGLTSGSALINLQDLGTTMVTAFVSGALFSGTAVTGSKAKNVYSNFKNSKAVYEEIKDTPIGEVTPKQSQAFVEALQEDVKDPANKQVVLDQAKIAIANLEQSMPVNAQVSQLQKVLQKVYGDDVSKMTPEQQVARKEYIGALEEKVAELNGQKTAITANGKKFSVEQLQNSIQRGEAKISALKNELANETRPNEKLNLQDDIDTFTQMVNQKKQSLAQATQVPLTSAELLAKMQAPRAPVQAPVASSNQIPQQSAQNVSNQAIEGQGASVTAPAVSYQDNVQAATDIANAPTGFEVESVISPNKHITSTLKAIQLTSGTASTDADGNINPNYPRELQPRNDETKFSRVRTAKMSTESDNLLHVGIETIQRGTPVVSYDGKVVTGNHRWAAFLLMLRDNPVVYGQYKDYVRKNAKKFGLNAADLQGNFVLVRVLPEGTDLKSLVDIGNDSGVATMSSSEIAVNDSKNLTDSVMNRFVADENGEMTGAENKAFNDRFINEVVPESERGSMRDRNGDISMSGLRRIQNAMFYKAYGSLDLLTLVSESTDNNVKKLTNTLINVSPRIVTLKEGIAAGVYYDLPTAQLITGVAKKWVSMKQSKNGKDVLAYLKGDTKTKQADMFNEKEDPLEMSLILAFETNRGSSKNLTALVNDIIDLHMSEGAPTSGFFGTDKTVNMEMIVRDALKGEKYGTIQELESLYAKSGDGSDEAVAAVGPAESRPKEVRPVGNATQEVQRKTEGVGTRTESVKQKTDNVQVKSADQASLESAEKKGESLLEAMANTPDPTFNDNSTMGIVPRGFSSSKSLSTVEDFGLSEETKASMKRTATFPDGKNGLRDTVRRIKKWIGNPNWGSVEVSNKYGDLKRAIRLKRTSHVNASNIAVDVVNKSYGTLDQREIGIFKTALVFLDIRENIKGGMYDEGKAPLPHGVKTMIEMETIITNAENILKKPENANVRKAMVTRKKLMDVLRDQVIAAGKKVGIDLAYIKSRDFYVYNAPYEMYAAEESNKLYSRGTAKYKTRSGTAVDYISNPIVSDYLIIDKLAKDLFNLEVLAEVVALDVSDKIKYDEDTGEKIIPEGYLVCSKNEVMGNVQATNELEKNAVVHAAEFLKQNGINPKSDVGKTIIRNARALERKAAIVIPADVYNVTVDEYTKKQAQHFMELYRKAYHLWKFSKIRAPFVVWKYNYRNTMGDLEMTFVGRPAAIFGVPSSMWQLYKYFYLGNRTNVDVMNFLQKTGGVSGQTIQTLNEVDKIPDLGFLPKSASPKDWAKMAVKKAWGAITLEKFTNYREQVLRYAAYMNIKKDLVRHNGKVRNYIASSREEIDSIRDTDDKAIKLATDLLGAYDDISKLGQTIANNLVPFFRFQEIMVKRYVRMTQNAFYVDGSVINKTGADYAKRAGHIAKIGAVGTMRLGRLLILQGLFYAAISAGNMAFAPDDEEKLPEDVRKQPHIIFPSCIFGDKSRVYYLANLGVFSQMLGTFGLDYADGALIRDLFTGKKTWEEVTSEVSLGFNPLQAVMGVNPLMVSLFEVATGKKGYYFDPENPSEMRDRLAYIFDQAGFGPVYTYLAKLPANESTYTNALANSVATGDAAMWAVYDMTDEFYAEYDITPGTYEKPKRDSTEWKKKNAAYYYKVALRLGDEAAIEKYLAEYVMYGGTKKSLDASVASLEPLRFMDKDYLDDFLAQLTPEETKKLETAREYFKEISAQNVDYLAQLTPEEVANLEILYAYSQENSKKNELVENK